jgi:hypothetical protein
MLFYDNSVVFLDIKLILILTNIYIVFINQSVNNIEG